MKGLQVYQPPPYPIPSLPPFRAGGFYDASFPFCSTAPDVTLGTTDGWVIPTWIPAPSLLVNLGIEVTAKSAGAYARIGVYDAAYAWDAVRQRSVMVPYPDRLICETGAIDTGSANGYMNGAVTYRNGYKKLPQGLCFVAFNQYVSVGTSTLRAVGDAAYTGFFCCGFITSTNSALWNTRWGVLKITAFSLLKAPGWPLRFPFQSMAANQMQTGAQVHPHVVMEF